jgi:adenosylcobinamide-GDP ribazoletransferase
MYSKIPVPQVEWERVNLRLALAMLPIVGCVIAGLDVLWLTVSARFSGIVAGAGLTLIPLLISGGIHMDGFADTVDALSSHASPERKREILKDPHAGAFAVIWVAAYLIAYFALCTESQGAVALPLIPVLSRAVTAIASLTFPGSKSGGLLETFRSSGGRGAVAIAVAWSVAVVAAAVLWLEPLPILAVAATMALCALYVRVMSKRQFGGMSGDLAGYLLQLCELAGLAAISIVKVVQA